LKKDCFGALERKIWNLLQQSTTYDSHNQGERTSGVD
jgi:hypothetical protein